MTGIKTGTGGTVAGREVFRSAMPVKSAKPEKTVRVKGEQISVKPAGDSSGSIPGTGSRSGVVG